MTLQASAKRYSIWILKIWYSLATSRLSWISLQDGADLAKEYEGQIVIYKVDVDKEKELAQAFNVSSIPAVLYIPLGGEPVMTVGARGKERFKEEIGTLLLQK